MEGCSGCENSFKQELAKFKFNDIRKADPPRKKGVYIITIEKRGRPFHQAIQELTTIANNSIGWEIVKKYVIDKRMTRLEQINHCNVIYIGSAGTYKGSKNTLKGRYEDFASRHTIQFPLWLLLYLGWSLQYGYFVSDSPKQFEEDLKTKFKEYHEGSLPALVDH